jgi:hypothetical protein
MLTGLWACGKVADGPVLTWCGGFPFVEVAEAEDAAVGPPDGEVAFGVVG